MTKVRHRAGASAALLILALSGCSAAHPASSGPTSTSSTTASSSTASSSTTAPSGPPDAGRVLLHVPVGTYPDGEAVGFGSLWSADLGASTVSRINPANGRVLAAIRVPSGPISLLVTGDAVWSADYDGTTVARIDPTRDRVVQTIKVGARPVALALVGDTLWVFNQQDETASLVDPDTGKVRATVKTGVGAGFVTYYAHLLWVPDFSGGSHQVIAIDPASHRVVRRVKVGSTPLQIGFGYGSGWVGNGGDDTVSRFSPATGEARTINIGADAGALLVTGKAVWVASYQGNTLEKLDPVNDSVAGQVRMGAEPNGIVKLDGHLWVSESGAGDIAEVAAG